MGQVFSKNEKNKSPYEILNVNEFSSLKDIKRAYRSLYYKNQRNPEMMEHINSALNFVENNFDLDLYIELYKRIFPNTKIDKLKSIRIEDRQLEVFKDQEITTVKYMKYSFEFKFLEFTSEMFNKIVKAFKLQVPYDFNDNFSKFYSSWNRLVFDDKNFEQKIRLLIKILKENDPRVQSKLPEYEHKKNNTNLCKEEQPEVKDKNREKQFKVICTACNRGFNSRNTLKDHLNSKKHKSLSSSENSLIYNVSKETFERDEEPEITK